MMEDNQNNEKEHQLGAAIEKIPRIELASGLPTPIEPMQDLSTLLDGPDLYVKRDDLTGLAFGGNKTRMFEFSLADAIEENADVIVTGAAVQSNYCRQLAAACAKLDFELHLLLRPVEGYEQPRNQGNYLLMQLCGADITVLDKPGIDYQEKAISERIEELEERGLTTYWPRREDTIDLDAIAYTNVGLEISRQLRTLDIEPDYLYLAALDTTQAGLQLALEYLDSPIQVRGICPNKGWADRHERLARIANQAAQRLSLDVRFNADDFYNVETYTGEGYGIPTEQGIQAIQTAARTEGLILDPVYTGKAFGGLIADVRGGALDDATGPVLFLHTGGQPALFAYADSILT